VVNTLIVSRHELPPPEYLTRFLNCMHGS
jgi:hypothetical protein